MTVEEYISLYTSRIKEALRAKGIAYEGQVADICNALVSEFVEVHARSLSEIKKQMFINTADEEYAQKHLGNITKRKDPSQSKGQILFFGTVDTKIAKGTELVNQSGVVYETEEEATIKEKKYSLSIKEKNDREIILENTQELPDVFCDMTWKPEELYVTNPPVSMFFSPGDDSGLVFFDYKIDIPLNLVAEVAEETDAAGNVTTKGVAGSLVTAIFPIECQVGYTVPVPTDGGDANNPPTVPESPTTFEEQLTVTRIEDFGYFNVIVFRKPSTVIPDISGDKTSGPMRVSDSVVLKWQRELDRFEENVPMISRVEPDGSKILRVESEEVGYFHELKELSEVEFTVRSSDPVNVICKEFGEIGNVGFNGYLKTIRQITGVDVISMVIGGGIAGGYVETMPAYIERGLELRRNPYSGFSVYSIKRLLKDSVKSLKHVWIKGADNVDVEQFYTYIYALNSDFSLTTDEKEQIQDKILAIKPSDMVIEFIKIEEPTVRRVKVTVASIAPDTEDLRIEIKKNLESFFKDKDTFEKGVKREDVYFTIKEAKIGGSIYAEEVTGLTLSSVDASGEEKTYAGDVFENDMKGVFWRFGSFFVGNEEV